MATVHDNNIEYERDVDPTTATQLHAFVRMVSDLSDENLVELAACVRARLVASEHAAAMLHRQTDRVLIQIDEQLRALRQRIHEAR